MAPSDHAHRVGQRRLEEERPEEGIPSAPPETVPGPPGETTPGPPAVPAEGSAALLQRRRRDWLRERERRDGAAGTGSASTGAPADPPTARNG